MELSGVHHVVIHRLTNHRVLSRLDLEHLDPKIPVFFEAKGVGHLNICRVPTHGCPDFTVYQNFVSEGASFTEEVCVSNVLSKWNLNDVSATYLLTVHNN